MLFLHCHFLNSTKYALLSNVHLRDNSNLHGAWLRRWNGEFPCQHWHLEPWELSVYNIDMIQLDALFKLDVSKYHFMYSCCILTVEILTVTGSLCSCGLNNRICSHSAVQLQSCAPTSRPTCDPKPETETGKTSSILTVLPSLQWPHWHLLLYSIIVCTGPKQAMRCCCHCICGDQSTLTYLKSGPVPWSVPVCGSLQMAKLDLICGVGVVHLHWEFHLEKFVRLCPLHLKVENKNTGYFFWYRRICLLQISLLL